MNRIVVWVHKSIKQNAKFLILRIDWAKFLSVLSEGGLTPKDLSKSNDFLDPKKSTLPRYYNIHSFFCYFPEALQVKKVFFLQFHPFFL